MRMTRVGLAGVSRGVLPATAMLPPARVVAQTPDHVDHFQGIPEFLARLLAGW